MLFSISTSVEKCPFENKATSKYGNMILQSDRVSWPNVSQKLSKKKLKTL